MVKFSMNILQANKASSNVVYKSEELERIYKKAKKNKKEIGFKILNNIDELDQDTIMDKPFTNEIKNFSFELLEDSLRVNINVLKKSDFYKKLQENDYFALAVGEGEVSDDTKTVSDYELKYIVIVPNNKSEE